MGLGWKKICCLVHSRWSRVSQSLWGSCHALQVGVYRKQNLRDKSVACRKIIRKSFWDPEPWKKRERRKLSKAANSTRQGHRGLQSLSGPRELPHFWLKGLGLYPCFDQSLDVNHPWKGMILGKVDPYSLQGSNLNVVSWQSSYS